MFAPDKLTIGIFLPLKFYVGHMNDLHGQADIVEMIDQLNFSAVWVRDVPLFDRDFGDAGQLFDPFTYLAYLAARTKNVSLATGSAIFTLRHPIDLAESASSIDVLSGGRLVMGIASGDRPAEFPAYGIDADHRDVRFRETIEFFRNLIRHHSPSIQSSLGQLEGLELLPKPATGDIPLVVTGSSRQTLDWIAEHSDGWLTYPESTADSSGPRKLAQKISAWREKIPGGVFKPHMTNEWIDLVEDVNYPRTPLRGGYVLRTGRAGLIQLLEEWQASGVNHAALGIQFGNRPPAEVIQELGEEVLPLFPTHTGPNPLFSRW
ncbi:LLM class flavin-dependent oxidoreductase [Paenibacillus donghaensis]|uniref:LLM class flavin-dependent oxidoreductase n=2 Tax=Paenibacillus donghaensis TaxID=414771 RepID=A0A2Z2KRI9_9BACL|nr:LLM class flavin-dependent oxidoreductase [Paenibacillus donghaensis]